MTYHQLLSLTPELKKKMFCSLCQCSSKNWYKKPGKLTNYNSAEEIFMTQSILLKWNEISFSLKIMRLIFKSSIWSILSTLLMVSLGIQLNCLFSLPEMIAFLFPRIIYFNFSQMKADVFSQKQQFPYFRNSLLKLGQSCERHLDFYKRKEDQVNWIVNSLSFSA